MSGSYWLLALVACISVVQVAYADDINPPNVLNFDFGPKEVNVSASSQEVMFTIQLADDLSGVSSGRIQFVSPSGYQSADIRLCRDLFFGDNEVNSGCVIGLPCFPIFGDKLDCTFACKMKIPQYSEKGTWKLDYVWINDVKGNERRYSKSYMEDLGFPTEFEVVSEGDTEPPVLLNFDIEPKVIDTTMSPQDVAFKVHAADNLSGIGALEVSYHNPANTWVCTIGGGVLWPSRIKANFTW